MRLFCRRFTRLTLGYSKKIENLRHSLAIFIVFFNWIRAHSAHGQTPAQAIGLTDHAWTIRELLENFMMERMKATKPNPRLRAYMWFVVGLVVIFVIGTATYRLFHR